MSATSIEWCDSTWNPVRGCRRVSSGCERCYAERVAHRFSGAGRSYEGLTTGGRWNGKVRFAGDETLLAPAAWRKPQRIFVNSMSDLFYEGIDESLIDDVFDVMEATPRHTFMVLTKRPARMRDWVSAWRPHVEGGPSPLPNVWLGVSVEDQATADERIPLLLRTPAAVRFVSAEPLLGPVDVRPFAGPWRCGHHGVRVAGCSSCDAVRNDPRLDWVIVGGESGPKARPCDVAWIRSIVEQCRAAEVPCFVKQLGARPTGRGATTQGGPPGAWTLRDRKGGDPAEWPEDLRVREFPRAKTEAAA